MSEYIGVGHSKDSLRSSDIEGVAGGAGVDLRWPANHATDVWRTLDAISEYKPVGQQIATLVQSKQQAAATPRVVSRMSSDELTQSAKQDRHPLRVGAPGATPGSAQFACHLCAS